MKPATLIGTLLIAVATAIPAGGPFPHHENNHHLHHPYKLKTVTEENFITETPRGIHHHGSTLAPEHDPTGWYIPVKSHEVGSRTIPDGPAWTGDRTSDGFTGRSHRPTWTNYDGSTWTSYEPSGTNHRPGGKSHVEPTGTSDGPGRKSHDSYTGTRTHREHHPDPTGTSNHHMPATTREHGHHGPHAPSATSGAPGAGGEHQPDPTGTSNHHMPVTTREHGNHGPHAPSATSGAPGAEGDHTGSASLQLATSDHHHHNRISPSSTAGGASGSHDRHTPSSTTSGASRSHDRHSPSTTSGASGNDHKPRPSGDADHHPKYASGETPSHTAPPDHSHAPSSSGAAPGNEGDPTGVDSVQPGRTPEPTSGEQIGGDPHQHRSQLGEQQPSSSPPWNDGGHHHHHDEDEPTASKTSQILPPPTSQRPFMNTGTIPLSDQPAKTGRHPGHPHPLPGSTLTSEVSTQVHVSSTWSAHPITTPKSWLGPQGPRPMQTSASTSTSISSNAHLHEHYPPSHEHYPPSHWTPGQPIGTGSELHVPTWKEPIPLHLSCLGSRCASSTTSSDRGTSGVTTSYHADHPQPTDVDGPGGASGERRWNTEWPAND